MEAVGAYLERLRKARGYSRLALAGKLGTTDAQIGRVEKGEIDTRSSFLFRLIDTVQGSAEQIRRLMTDNTATAVDGQAAAEEWLKQQGVAVQAEVARIQAEPEEVRQQVASVYLRLADLIEAGYSQSDALRIVASELSPDSPEA